MIKLGYLVAPARGLTDPVLSDVAARLTGRGFLVAGVIQSRAPADRDHPCDMDLTVLPNGPKIAIAQKLGSASRGCRLDPESLEQASETVRQSLLAGANVLIVNKFGAQECMGRGFVPAFTTALDRGYPVLTTVNERNLGDFLAFAGGMETRLPLVADEIEAWLVR